MQQGLGPMRKREGFLDDPKASLKIVLWESFTDKVNEAETHTFTNIKVRKDYKEVYVNTLPEGCKIQSSDPFVETLAVPAQLPDNYTTTTTTTTTTMAKIQGVANFTIYFSCVKCNKKVTASDSPVVRCDN